ncbi:hypothetical protein F7R91_25430 [Streptomyces luteolifulvus]|uniref:Uncharacterized protein n=1 Tax=Streptomyces luteolifulvus TaxID=2615112 RepID=A0A6H9UVW7_9ACTN|nr:hypothetical protein F7R91_25430 [Streptomyces luteolifulvus]
MVVLVWAPRSCPPPCRLVDGTLTYEVNQHVNKHHHGRQEDGGDGEPDYSRHRRISFGRGSFRETAKTEGTRSKLKRLVERGWLDEDSPVRRGYGLGRVVWLGLDACPCSGAAEGHG